jgi:hypothetical protein
MLCNRIEQIGSPDPKNIFQRKNNNGNHFENLKHCPELIMDVLERIKDNRKDAQGNQTHNHPIKDRAGSVSVFCLVDNLKNPML